MSTQTSVSLDFSAAIAGLPRGNVNRTNDRYAEVVIQSGVLVCQGTDDKQCKLPTTSAEVAKALGIAPARVTSDSRFPSTNTAGSTYQIGDTVGAIPEGAVWVTVEDAVTAGNSAYVRFAANSPRTQKGAFRSDGDDPGGGATAAVHNSIKFLTSTSGAGLALVSANLP
jgi:hypothetical protein